MKRPTGVTILAVLAIIGGVLEIFAALSVIGLLFAALALSGAAAAGGAVGGAASVAAAGLVGIFVTIWLGILGVISVIYGVGALGLKPWAWTVGVIWCYVAAISDVVNMFTSRGGIISAIIGILIALAILYYLFTDEVRAAFGKMDKQPPGFLVPVFDAIDGMMSNRRGGTPQSPGGYQPPQSPGGYQPPTMPANYEAPLAPTMPPTDIPAPPAPPAPPQ